MCREVAIRKARGQMVYLSIQLTTTGNSDNSDSVVLALKSRITHSEKRCLTLNYLLPEPAPRVLTNVCLAFCCPYIVMDGSTILPKAVLARHAVGLIRLRPFTYTTFDTREFA